MLSQHTETKEVTMSKADRIAKEYEEFVYIVSHDLSAPIRHIKEFTKLLLESREADFNDNEKQYKEFIDSSFEKLDKMQAALLTLSRINTEASPFYETVESQVLIDAALSELEKTYPSCAQSVSCKDLPSITVNPVQFTTVFKAIIDNALKFHPTPKTAAVTILATKNKNGTQFEICDNGIGIDLKYTTDVFNIFRRLHPDNRYDGIGIGLALSKKIVEKHSGTIWIEPNKDQGISVFLTVPDHIAPL